MNQLSARRCLVALCSFLLLLLGAAPAARAAYVPIAVTGYNADVVANGPGTAISSITADVDGAGYAFMAADFNPLGALPTAYLPINNTVYSVATSGVKFQLAPYNANNSLRLAGITSGTLTTVTNPNASEVYLLAVTGSGAGTADITVTFTDATTQAFTSVAIPDWYGGANFAIRGLGRVNTASNGIDNNPSDPRLYEIKLSLSAVNQAKQVASITVSKTTTTGVINVMGVAVNTAAPCAAPASQPTALLLTPGATTVAISYNAATPAADKYLIVRTPAGAALTATPANGTTYIAGNTLGNGTVVSAGPATSFSDAGLTLNTLYRYTVFAYNDACTSGPVYNTAAPLTATANTGTTSYANVPATGYNADVVADGAGNASASTTADVDGAGYAFMAPSYNPGSGGPTQFLPATGLVNSATTSGLSFQIPSYSGNNSLRIAATGTGTLTFNTPAAASDVYLMATSGSGASTANITVTFTDATTQVFSGVAIADWYGGGNYAILGVGRVNIATNGIDNNTANPRLYEVRLTIGAANYTKQIASVAIAKTSTAGVINVMGMAISALPNCVAPTGTPTGLVLLPGASGVNISFTAASPNVNKYLIVRTNGVPLTGAPVNGTTYTAGASLGNGTIVSLGSANTYADAGLTSGASYTYTVFGLNDVCAGGPLYNTTPLSGTVTTNSATTYTWTGATNFTWTVPGNWSPARNVPDASDILQFNNGQNNAVYGIPTQTVSRIVLSNNTTAQFQSSAAVTLTIASDNIPGTAELDIAAGSTLLMNGSALTSSSLTLAFSGTGSTANIAGTLETFGLVTYGGNNLINFNNVVATVTPTGTLATGGTQTTAAIQNSTPFNLIINGTFNYKFSSTSNPAMPAANWSTGSTTMISGFNTATGGPNGGMNQVFYNFTYDCKSQTSNTNWSGTGPLIANGTFTMSSTGTGTLQFASTQGYSYQVNNYNHAGGTLNLASGIATATPTLSISGTFNQTGGTLTATGNSTGLNAPTLNFNGTAAQSVTFLNAAPVGPIVYRVSNPAGINLNGAGTLTSAFNINNNGGVRISTAAANPVNTALILTYSATGTTLTYDALAPATMTANVFPTTNGPVNLYINSIGAANLVTMPFSRTVPGTLTMLSGDVDLGGNTLTLGTSATSAGTLTYTAGGIRVSTGGSFVRWYGTSGLPTAPGTGVGFYPMAYSGLNRNVALYFSTATALSTGGTIGVSHTNVQGFTNGLSVADGAYTIDTRTNSSWSFAASGVALSGTIGMRLTGLGLFTSNNPANLRVMKAAAVAGTHVAGSGVSAQRSGLALSDLSVPFYIGAAAVDITGVYTAINTGNWSTGSTWDIGVAPGIANDAFINPGVVVTSNAATNTAKSLYIDPAGTLVVPTGNTVTLDSALQIGGTLSMTGGLLTVNGNTTISGITNNGAGVINLSAGTITLGPAGGANRPFSQNGTLNVTGGTLNVNGNFVTSSPATINQSGGDINVDGNAGGVLANSVACGTPIVNLTNAANNFTGGTFTVVDPQACTTGTNTMVYNNAANITATGTHVFRMGNGISTDPGGQTPYNFSVNTSVTSQGKFSFNDLVINCGTATNSYFVQGSATMGIQHDLIVNNGGEFRNNASTQTTYINNNLTVNTGGTYSGLGTTAFANFSLGSVVAGTNAQTVSGGGLFRNVATATPTAKFNSLLFNNAGGNVTFNIGNVPYSGAATFTLGKAVMASNSIMIQNAGASLTGPAQTTGWVVGRFQKNATAGGLAHFYPVGDLNYYTPLNINGTVAIAGDIVVGVTIGDHPNVSNSGINPGRSVNRYWSVQQLNGLTFSSAGATVIPNWAVPDIDAGAVPANFIAAKYTASVWTLPASSAQTTTSITATVPLTIIDGDYAVGETCTPVNITTQPVSQTVCAGSPFTLSVGLTSTAGVTYQWRKNGVNIAGATSGTFTIPATTVGDAGSYTVVVSSPCIAVAPITSMIAALVVNAPPAITTQPASQAVCELGTVTFTVAATGTGVGYQWYKNGTLITGATGTTYSINNLATIDAGNYTVVVSGTSPCASATSVAAVLTVNPLPLTITAASSTNFCAGGSVVLNAASSAGFSYQWKLNGSNITGATNPSYTATASGNYTAFLSNAATGCNGTSNTIAVQANSAPTATITPTPAAAFCTGGSTTLSGPTPGGVTYQWNNNGTPIPGATNPTYTAAAGGSYTLTVALSSLSTCSSTSPATVVTVNPLPPASIGAGGPTTVCAGTPVVLNANTGAGLSYAWQLNGAPVIPAATGNSYTATSAGTYTLVVTNTATGCQNTSAGTTITYNPLPTATIAAAGATTFCQNGSVVLNANTGTGLSYVWYQNGVAIVPAATGASYTATTSGNYTVRVTNTTTGCFQTSPATLVTVNPLPNVTVSSTGTNSFCQGSNVTLSVPAASGQTYQWQLNGGNIAGATSASYAVNAAGTYAVVVTIPATGCTATSASTTTSVNPLPVATITTPVTTTVCQGDTVVLSTNAGAGLSYQWNINGTPVNNATAATYPATATGAYTVKVTNSTGCSTTSAPVTVTIKPAPTSIITYASPITFCEGGGVVLTAQSPTATSYQWNNNGAPVAGSTVTYSIINTTGVYTVTVTNSVGCSATSAPVPVQVNPLPAPVITQSGATLSTGSFAAYQWYFNGQPMPSAVSQSVNITQNGAYAVMVTDANGCRKTTELYFVNGLGVNNAVLAAAIKIYPNPVHSLVHIDAPVPVNIAVHDFTGRIVLQGYGVKEMDMSALADGAYVLFVTDKEGRMVKMEKLLKSDR